MTEFVLPALLVGVMHYITVHRQDKNELGAATLDALGTKVYKRERVYGGKLGAKIQRAIRTQHSYDADSGCETSEVTSASTEDNPDGQKKDTHSIIEGKILASAQAMADAWQDAVDRLADDMSGQAAKAPAYKSLNEEMLSDKDKALLEKFRDHIEEILHYCIDNDPSAGATRITLADEIHDVCRAWNFELRKIKDTAFRQLVIDKDSADTIIGNCDTSLFLGGKEPTTLKELNQTLGKETIDTFNTGESRGREVSHSLNYQKLGKDLATVDELAVLDGGKCILQLRGVRPFLSDKYDITKHPNYKYLSDADKRNEFDIERFLSRRLKPKPDEVYDVYDIDASVMDAGETAGG